MGRLNFCNRRHGTNAGPHLAWVRALPMSSQPVGVRLSVISRRTHLQVGPDRGTWRRYAMPRGPIDSQQLTWRNSSREAAESALGFHDRRMIIAMLQFIYGMNRVHRIS